MVKKSFEAALAEVDRMVDRLGMHVDESIRKTVAGLMMHEIATSASCEGHLERGMPYPWVDIEIAESIDDDTKALPAEIKKLQDDFERMAEEFGVHLYNTVVSPENDRRYAIHIDDKGTIGWEFKVKDESKSKLERLELRKKLLLILGQFYASRKPTYENTLVLGSVQNMRLLSVGSIGLEREDEKIKQRKLKEFQDEMQAFGEFLVALGS